MKSRTEYPHKGVKTEYIQNQGTDLGGMEMRQGEVWGKKGEERGGSFKILTKLTFLLFLTQTLITKINYSEVVSR